MKLRQTIPIGTQILILPGITLLGFILVLFSQYLGLSNQAKINEINLRGLNLTNNLRVFQQQITWLTVSEKNFFATGMIAYSKDHKKAMDTLLATIDNIQANQNPIIDSQRIQKWRSMLAIYQNGYKAASNDHETIGFSENTGLRGTMRNAIHSVEAQLKNRDPALMRDMLLIRRHEKDFIIRGKEKFFRQWEASIGTFNQTVKAAHLSPVDQTIISFETNLYVKGFRNLAAHKRHLKHNLAQNDIISNNIIRSVGLAFTKASVYAREQINSRYSSSISQFRNIAILTFFIGVIAVLTSRWIGGGIRSSFNLITTAMTRLARGEVNTRIPATSYKNEIGEMAKALRFFRENEKHRLLADINLKSAKKQTEDIVKTMYEGLLEIDVDGIIISTNPAASDLLGLDEEAITGQNITKFFSLENDRNSKKFHSRFLKILLSKQSKAQMELQLLNSVGKTIPVACSNGLLLDSENRKVGAILTIHDITEQKAAEQAKSDFLSTVSHELRTPLTSIKGALGIMDSGVLEKLGEKSQKMVSIALSNSNRLIKLINDILDYEKIEAGKMEFKMAPMDATKMILDSIEANGGYATTWGIKFVAKGVDQPVMVSGDKDRLMQVMSNLMSNAAKFSKKGSVVTISLEQNNGSARISVSDTGSGIPQAAQATIFNRFTQADSSDQRKKGGTGLGLNIVKNMVAAHGGNIAFTSVEGEGTTFYFDLVVLTNEAHNKSGHIGRTGGVSTDTHLENLHTCEHGSAAYIASSGNSERLNPENNTQQGHMN